MCMPDKCIPDKGFCQVKKNLKNLRKTRIGQTSTTHPPPPPIHFLETFEKKKNTNTNPSWGLMQHPPPSFSQILKKKLIWENP